MSGLFAFLAGIMVGVIVGVFLTALCVAASRADRATEAIIARDTSTRIVS